MVYERKDEENGNMVRKEFHKGEWTETDNWMEEHPGIVYFVAAIFLSGILGLIVLVIWVVLHP